MHPIYWDNTYFGLATNMLVSSEVSGASSIAPILMKIILQIIQMTRLSFIKHLFAAHISFTGLPW